MFAISPTDNDWYNFLKLNGYNSYINFWTPTPWNIKTLKKGEKFYFMLKSPIRKLGGFGEFVEYNNLTANAAWNQYGYRNGRNSKDAFLLSIDSYIKKNSERYWLNSLDPQEHNIGCIILNNCEFWDEKDFVTPSDYGLEFSSNIVTIKYFKEYDLIEAANESINFNLINEPRENNKKLINAREGQSSFKGKILKIYYNCCCITGDTTPELLEAAHIQAYKNLSSNHIKNGLLMRVDVHRLYDNNLLFIDKDYIIHISSQIQNSMYSNLHGKKITLPIDKDSHPSIEALEQKRNDFRM